MTTPTRPQFDRTPIASPVLVVSLEQIIDEIARTYGTTADVLTGHTRNRVDSIRRRIAMWVAHQGGFTYDAIADGFDRHRTSVFQGVKEISKLRESHDDLAHQTDTLLAYVEDLAKAELTNA